MEFGQELSAIMHRDPAKPIVEYKGRIFSKGEYAALADRINALLDDNSVSPSASIALITRNRPLHAACILGLVSNGRWLTSVYVIQSAQAIAQEIEESRFAAVIADVDDWTEPLMEAACRCGSLGISLNNDDSIGIDAAINLVTGLERPGPGPFREMTGEPGIEILSSGTTGKPKRVRFPTRMLVRAIDGAIASSLTGAEPDILVWPYSGIGGICCLVASAALDRYTCLLEKFSVDEWVDAIERLQPASVTGVPAMARMILDAKVPKERLASLRYFFGGSAPMTQDLQQEFESAYGIDVIWAYGATEFCGTVISWSPDLHTRYRQSKAGSIGRPLPSIEVRAAHFETGVVVPPGEEGFLEVLVPVIGDDWIRTTDIVVIDDDGFVFHKGRGDGAILRGGHKILPEKVVDVLRSHPAVLDASVVGIPDDRLGSIPVAAVELRSGVDCPSPDMLRDHCRAALPSPQIPAKIEIVASLPRTTSLKVDLMAVKLLFQA